jgi:hypothetical protein
MESDFHNFRHQFEGPRKVNTGLAAVIKGLLVQKLGKLAADFYLF